MIEMRPDHDAFVSQLRIRALDDAGDVVADAVGEMPRSHAVSDDRSQRKGIRLPGLTETLLERGAREPLFGEQRIGDRLADHGWHESLDPVPVRMGVRLVVDIDKPHRAFLLRGSHPDSMLIVILEGCVRRIRRAAEAEDELAGGLDARIIVVPENRRADAPSGEDYACHRIPARREEKRHEIFGRLEHHLPDKPRLRNAAGRALRIMCSGSAEKERHLGLVHDRIGRGKRLQIPFLRADRVEPPLLELRCGPLRRGRVSLVPGEAPGELARSELLAVIVRIHRADRVVGLELVLRQPLSPNHAWKNEHYHRGYQKAAESHRSPRSRLHAAKPSPRSELARRGPLPIIHAPASPSLEIFPLTE